VAARPVVRFLEGEGTDARGRTVFDVISMNDVAIERTHDFIQWLFPLPEPSAAIPESPMLTPEDIQAIRISELAPMAMGAGADRMAAFYQTTHDWLMPNDHNHRRITRIIRSLRLLVGDAEADAFHAFIVARVEATQAPVSARSRGYWATA